MRFLEKIESKFSLRLTGDPERGANHDLGKVIASVHLAQRGGGFYFQVGVVELCAAGDASQSGCETTGNRRQQ